MATASDVGISRAETLARLDPEERHQYLASLDEKQARALLHDWEFWARPEQLEPEGEWFCWAIMGGRGSGKTRSGSEWITKRAIANPGCRIALVGATPGDVRDVMVEGPSGVCNVGHPDTRPFYESSKRLVLWPNGSRATVFSAADPKHIHGPEHHFAWADEPSVWTIPKTLEKNPEMNPWTSLVFGLRLGDAPQVVATFTPRKVGIVKAILARDDAVLTQMSTYANLANLAETFVNEVIKQYEGTSLGQAFIHGKLLTETVGALWKEQTIDKYRCTADGYPPLKQIYTGVDPPGGLTECGIVTVGRASDDDDYVLEDASMRAAASPHRTPGVPVYHTPLDWANQAIDQYEKWQGDGIVVEKNYGGDMVKQTIATAAKERGLGTVPLFYANATRGKHIRAEPVASRSEQGHIHHCGVHELLEEELTNWVPGDASPNRLDAYVWALSKLMGKSGKVIARWV